MTTNQSQPVSAPTAGTGFPGESLSTKVYVAGIRSVFAVLLSLAGIGSAMAQSADQDMWMRASTQAARERTISEVRQARGDGTIWRWSPAFIEIQLKPRRTVPYVAQRDYAGDLARVTSPIKAPVPGPDSRDIPIAAAE